MLIFVLPSVMSTINIALNIDLKFESDTCIYLTNELSKNNKINKYKYVASYLCRIVKFLFICCCFSY